MKEHIQKPANASRAIGSNSRTSRQAPLSEILQAYNDGTLGRRSIPGVSIENEDLLQAKTAQQDYIRTVLRRYKERNTQRYVPEEEALLQGKSEPGTQIEQKPVQREEKAHNTWLPDNLKTDIHIAQGQEQQIIQKHPNRNRRRWTPKQREQSRKFWEKKIEREKRKELSLETYIKGMRKDHSIIITKIQAETYSKNGFSRQEIADICKTGITPDEIIKLIYNGFTKFAIKGVKNGYWTLENILEWNGNEPPENLINSILRYKEISPWKEEEHETDKANGSTLIGKKPKEIESKLRIKLPSKAIIAYSLSEPDYKSAVLYEAVKQALQSHRDLHADIFRLVDFRIEKLSTENALQSSGKIFLKKDKITNSTVVHELIHFYGAQDKFIKDFCFGKADRINEGFTEYFGQKVVKPTKDRKRTIYPYWVNAVDFLEKKLGKQILINAYFKGEITQLKNEYKKILGKEWSESEEDTLYWQSFH